MNNNEINKKLNNKEVDKIIRLVKNGKITISNNSLVFSKEYVRLQKQKQKQKLNQEPQQEQINKKISGFSHKKGETYLGKNLKLSDKVFFYCTKSGKLSIRGGKKAALNLESDIRNRISRNEKLKRVSAERTAVYNAILKMLEDYIDKKTKTVKPVQINDISEVAATSEPVQPNTASETIHPRAVHNYIIDNNIGNKSAQHQTTVDIKEAIFKEVHSKNPVERFRYLRDNLYNKLTPSNQREILHDYLAKGNSHFNLALFDSIKMFLFRKKIEDEFISEICDNPASPLAQDFYVLYGNQRTRIPTEEYKESIKKISDDFYNKLTRKQRYEMRYSNFYFLHNNKPNLFQKAKLYFPRTSKADDGMNGVFVSIKHNSYGARKKFEAFINPTNNQDEVNTSKKRSNFRNNIKVVNSSEKVNTQHHRTSPATNSLKEDTSNISRKISAQYYGTTPAANPLQKDRSNLLRKYSVQLHKTTSSDTEKEKNVMPATSSNDQR